MPLDDVSDAWWVQVQERAYGPYTHQQITRFVAEGRVNGATLVSHSDRGGWREARNTPAIEALLNDQKTTFKQDSSAKPADVVAANLVIYAQIMSGSPRGFERELRALGSFVEVSEGFYLVRTTHTAGTVRNTLSLVLSHGDKFMVVDATRERLAWFNMGPEIDVRIRDVWNAPITTTTR